MNRPTDEAVYHRHPELQSIDVVAKALDEQKSEHAAKVEVATPRTRDADKPPMSLDDALHAHYAAEQSST